MLEIRNNAEPTSQVDDINNFPLAIYEMGDGYSWKNADLSWLKNVYARADELLYQVG